MTLVVQILGGVIIALGIYLVLARALGAEGSLQMPGVAINVPSSVLVLLAGVGVFLFPLSPWWPGQSEPSGAALRFGDDPELDQLWAACEKGDFAACDDLYWASPLDSEYEKFALSCGGPGPEQGCVADRKTKPPADETGEDPQTVSASSFGDDPELDLLWTACDQGDFAACDELYWLSPVDSDYELFALTCGGRAFSEISCVAAYSEETETSPPVALASGLFCDEVAAAGYGFAHALVYWVREGRPDRMDANHDGIPCETEFSTVEVDAVLGFDSQDPLASKLFCRDLANRGYGFEHALVYWVREGAPDRMDADRNGLPCETVYPSQEINDVMAFDE